MQVNVNYKQQQRRWSPSSKKSWCRMPISENIRNCDLFYTRSFSENKKNTRKSFRSLKQVKPKIFILNLNNRFKRRFKRPVKFRINLRCNKIQYFDGELMLKIKHYLVILSKM